MNKVIEMNFKELEGISGGNIFESEAGEGEIKYIDLYRCGITFNKGFFTSDTYDINGHEISKDMAGKIAKEGLAMWKAGYKDSADSVGFAKAWKSYLKDNYGISWNGQMGKRNSGF